jgi:hypothetical protein
VKVSTLQRPFIPSASFKVGKIPGCAFSFTLTGPRLPGSKFPPPVFQDDAVRDGNDERCVGPNSSQRRFAATTPEGRAGPRNMEYGVRRNQLHGQFLTGCVDELGKTLHCKFVVFHCHIGHTVWSTTRICSSFIRPPCTLNPARALAISFRSSAVSTSLVDSMFS